jgi:hypothetical protein
MLPDKEQIEAMPEDLLSSFVCMLEPRASSIAGSENDREHHQYGCSIKNYCESSRRVGGPSRKGVAEAPLEARSRVEAATDLMEQVQILLDDRKVHPAGPVMLAGAALEEFLRSMIVTSTLQPKGKPGITEVRGSW